MDYDKLDNDELLRLALKAINGAQDADAVAMLKTLLERQPGHVFATYLLAAQYAQLGMMDRAKMGFRAVVEADPEFPIARFQLGQLLLLQGASREAREVLAPLTTDVGALGAYARALSAAALEDLSSTVSELEAGLVLPQEIPALELDMQHLLSRLRGLGSGSDASPPGAAKALFLSSYGREA